MRYSILDPTGNITALVESSVDVQDQPSVAAQIMKRHPSVEQVGFVRYGPSEALGQPVDVALRMAGGEFCGNATLCAAALASIRGMHTEPRVTLSVSGAKEPVEVRLRLEGTKRYAGCVRMPNAKRIHQVMLEHDGITDKLPLVELEGISHLVIPAGSAFHALLQDRPAAEKAVRAWCERLGVAGLGLMFFAHEDHVYHLTPLVYVPVGDTVFWEHSCASGSAAVGEYLTARNADVADVSLLEPGGTLHVHSDRALQQTWLHGTVQLVESFQT